MEVLDLKLLKPIHGSVCAAISTQMIYLRNTNIHMQGISALRFLKRQVKVCTSKYIQNLVQLE